jgi:protein-S-isoprenylcysteine O-methyltransferase Ste14
MRIKGLLATIAEIVLFAILLFGAAGTIAWPGAWAFLAILFGFSVAMTWIIARDDPALLAQRLKLPIQRGQQHWDQILMAMFTALFIGWLPLMAIDARRYRWSAVPAWIQWIGGAAIIVSFGLCYRVFRENTYLAPVVRIQRERGHHVIDSGPYGIVRHPLYASVMIFFPGVTLLLGSWYGLIVAALMMALLVVRTSLEDQMLQRELEGYADYAAKVRFRLIPGLW